MSIYKDRMDRIQPQTTPEELAARVIGGKETERHYSARPAAVIAAVAAAAAAMTVTVGAVSDWNYSKLIGSFFPAAVTDNGQVSQELVDDAAKKLSGTLHQANEVVTTSTFENYDVTMGDYIFDGQSIYTSFTFKSKDGTPFTQFTKGYSYDFYEWLYPDNGDKFYYSGGGRSGAQVQEDGSIIFEKRFSIRGEVTEPVDVKIVVSDFAIICNSDEEYKKLPECGPNDTITVDGHEYTLKNGLCVAKDGEPSDDGNLVKTSDGVTRFLRYEDYATSLDDGVFTAEFTLYPVSNTVSLTLSDENGVSLDVIVAPSYIKALDSVKLGSTDPLTGLSGSGILRDGLFIYDKNGSVMISPDDPVDGKGGSGGYENGVEFALSELPIPIDPEEIGAIRIGKYTYGDAPEIDFEKYPYLDSFYGLKK